MFCKLLERAAPAGRRSLRLPLAVFCLAISLSGCTPDSAAPAQDPANVAQEPAQGSQGNSQHARIAELREEEHRTVKHPDRDFYAGTWPDGFRVSFETAQGHFGDYSFPKGAFPIGEPVFLLPPGSPDLLPLRVVRLPGEADQRYRVEWLDGPPAPDGATTVVRSY